MKVLKVRSSHKNSNSKKKQSQFSIIFILASQYRSHSVLLSSAVHCPRWFLSMGSRRLHIKVEPPPSGAPWEPFYTAK